MAWMSGCVCSVAVVLGWKVGRLGTTDRDPLMGAQLRGRGAEKIGCPSMCAWIPGPQCPLHVLWAMLLA